MVLFFRGQSLTPEEHLAFGRRFGDVYCPAMSAFVPGHPDIMLLDIIMPRMPGGNVVALFQADPVLRNLPIVFLTAAVQRRRVEEMDGSRVAQLSLHRVLAESNG